MQIEITVDIGAGPRSITFDPENITLGFLEDLEEAQASNKWGPLRRAIASLLGFTDAESRAITMRQFRAIASALGESAKALDGEKKD